MLGSCYVEGKSRITSYCVVLRLRRFFFSMYKKYCMEQGHYNPKIREMKKKDKMVHMEQFNGLGCDHLRGPHPVGCQSLVSLGSDRRIVLL